MGSNSDDDSVALAFGIHPAQLVEQMGRARILVRSYYPGATDYCKLGREVARDVVLTSFARRITYLQSAKAPILRYYFSRSGSSPNGAGYGAVMRCLAGGRLRALPPNALHREPVEARSA